MPRFLRYGCVQTVIAADQNVQGVGEGVVKGVLFGKHTYLPPTEKNWDYQGWGGSEVGILYSTSFSTGRGVANLKKQCSIFVFFLVSQQVTLCKTGS